MAEAPRRSKAATSDYSSQKRIPSCRVGRRLLSAFLAFGRSVFDVLKREVGQAEAATRTCFAPIGDAFATEPLRDMGNMVLHEGKDPARAEHTLVASPGMYVISGIRASAVVIRADGTTETVNQETQTPQSPTKEVPNEDATRDENRVRYFFSAGVLKDQEVLGKCRDYLARLQQAIIEAERCGA